MWMCFSWYILRRMRQVWGLRGDRGLLRSSEVELLDWLGLRERETSSRVFA